MFVAQEDAASGYKHARLLRDCILPLSVGRHDYTPQRLLASLPPPVSGNLFLWLSAKGLQQSCQMLDDFSAM